MALRLVLAALVIAATQAEISADNGFPQSDTVLWIRPALTDAAMATNDAPHLVVYDRSAKAGNILLFLSGTGGKPPGPVRFLNAAVERGYRVISLSYVDTPAVAQVCIGEALADNADCAMKFRERRIYGRPADAPIDDPPQDAILNRFGKLLQYLTVVDPQGRWNQYLDGTTPNWDRVAIAGLSQGGGMAEFVAQRQMVARVVIFSGGWDRSSRSQIARWYFGTSVTPPDRWFAAYNVAEPMANVISQTYKALRVPPQHIFSLNLPVRPGHAAHVDGIGNPAYANVWEEMLGNGAP